MGVGGDPAKGSGGAVSTEAFTWQDVAKHTTEQSAWVIFRDSKGDSGVYDITGACLSVCVVWVFV